MYQILIKKERNFLCNKKDCSALINYERFILVNYVLFPTQNISKMADKMATIMYLVRLLSTVTLALFFGLFSNFIHASSSQMSSIFANIGFYLTSSSSFWKLCMSAIPLSTR